MKELRCRFFFCIIKVKIEARIIARQECFDWQRDSPVRDAGYEPFDSILCPNRSQKSQEISIRRSSNDVRTLRGQESRRAEFSSTRQHPSLTVTVDLRRRLMTCRCQ